MRRPTVARQLAATSGDRGSTLPELVIAMLLTTTAMAALVGVISSSAGTVERISADDPLATVTVDWVANDLRAATAIDVVSHTGSGDVTTIDIATPSGAVRWETSGGTIERTAPGAVVAQPVLDGVRTTEALRLRLRNATELDVDPADVDAVNACTRFVRIQLLGPDDVVLHERTVSLRYPLWQAPTC